MLKFFDDFEKTNKPAPVVTDQDNTVAGITPEAVPSITVDDMKAYFDSMKESFMNELKDQMAAMQTTTEMSIAPVDPNNNTNIEGSVE